MSTMDMAIYVTFRSTGSYEPDPMPLKCNGRSDRFDPQALTSLTSFRTRCRNSLYGFDPQALTSLTPPPSLRTENSASFDPQALTSLTPIPGAGARTASSFRSTGSYEPDLLCT